MSIALRLFAVFAFLVAASPANAGFIKYSFVTDTSDSASSLSGSFQVDEVDLLDGVLSTADVQNFLFTFSHPMGNTIYALSDIVPEIEVDSTTGIPVSDLSVILGHPVMGAGGIIVDLKSNALDTEGSTWTADTDSSEVFGAGTGHWIIGPADANPVPSPAGIVLGLVGIGSLAAHRFRRRLA
jgi:hypothetical protein